MSTKRDARILAALLIVGAAWGASANDDVARLTSDPKNWAMQAGDFENHRHSKLTQINKQNVGKMHVAWTMSTGVLRGHEGAPLVVGDSMFIHTPFPNNVFSKRSTNAPITDRGCDFRR